jgi:hypothetical protein
VCGFDAADYTPLDLLGTLRALAPIWRTMTEGVDESVLATRPVPDAWSAIEHAAYTRDVIRGDVIAGAESEASPSLAAVITEIDQAVARVQAAATRGAADPAPSVDVVHAVHEGTHHVRAAGRGLHALGAGAPSTRGTLAQVSSSQGGVPKAALASAVVDHRGIVGDRQAERRHHGKPLQALSLWSQEVIDAAKRGHPVYASGGETCRVDWPAIRPACASRSVTLIETPRSRRRAPEHAVVRRRISGASTTISVPVGAAPTRGSSKAARSRPAMSSWWNQPISSVTSGRDRPHLVGLVGVLSAAPTRKMIQPATNAAVTATNPTASTTRMPATKASRRVDELLTFLDGVRQRLARADGRGNGLRVRGVGDIRRHRVAFGGVRMYGSSFPGRTSATTHETLPVIPKPAVDEGRCLRIPDAIPRSGSIGVIADWSQAQPTVRHPCPAGRDRPGSDQYRRRARQRPSRR